MFEFVSWFLNFEINTPFEMGAGSSVTKFEEFDSNTISAFIGDVGEEFRPYSDIGKFTKIIINMNFIIICIFKSLNFNI